MDDNVIYKPQNEVGNFLVHLYSKHRRFLKRTLVFLVTISVFSIFVCLSSGFSLLPNSYYVYFNTCLFSILTHTLERKYMFLICNGILVFLAKTSSCYYSNNYTLIPSFDPQLSIPPTLYSSSKPPLVSDLHVSTSIEEQEQKQQQEQEHKQEQEDDEEDGNKGEIVVKENEDEEQVSTEELNRRIEEFIRKMKEEIRIEAQQQLIAV